MFNMTQRLAAFVALLGLGACTGAAPYKGGNSDCKPTATWARAHCLDNTLTHDPFDDVIHQGAANVIAEMQEKYPEEWQELLEQTSTCDTDIEAALYDSESCIGAFGDELTEEQFGQCAIDSINRSPMPDSDRCAGEAGFSLDDVPQAYDAETELKDNFNDYLAEHSIVVGAQAPVSDILAATNIAKRLEFECDLDENRICEPVGMAALDSEIEDLYAQSRILVGLFEDNKAIQELYGNSRELFDSEVIGPAVLMKQVGEHNYIVVTGQTSEQVVDGARYLSRQSKPVEEEPVEEQP